MAQDSIPPFTSTIRSLNVPIPFLLNHHPTYVCLTPLAGNPLPFGDTHSIAGQYFHSVYVGGSGGEGTLFWPNHSFINVL